MQVLAQCERADFCTFLSPTVSSMAFYVVQGPEVSVQQRTCIWVLLEINNKYGSSTSMNTNGCEQIPEMKEMLCRNGIAELSMTEEPHWHKPLDICAWNLLPGAPAQPVLLVCPPCRFDGRSIHALCKPNKFHLAIQRKEMLFYTPWVFICFVPEAEELHVCFLKA